MTAPADFSPLEYKLYGRQMILPELGQSGQQKLKDAKVAVIGAGGLVLLLCFTWQVPGWAPWC